MSKSGPLWRSSPCQGICLELKGYIRAPANPVYLSINSLAINFIPYKIGHQFEISKGIFMR